MRAWRTGSYGEPTMANWHMAKPHHIVEAPFFKVDDKRGFHKGDMDFPWVGQPEPEIEIPVSHITRPTL